VGFAALERLGMKMALVWLWTSFAALTGSPERPELPAVDDSATVIVVVGAPGEKEYAATFESWARLWEKACLEAGAKRSTIGLDADSTNDLDQLKAVLIQEQQEPSRELWLVLIGHGTFDGREAKFNLRGPDLSATELASWLQPFRRPLAIINTSSASGPFINKLSAQGRVVITATRSGYEQNYARFAEFFSAAVSNLTADLDKDGQVSLLEAFLMAAHGVRDFYKTEGRLATEHPLLDDTGDGLGTPPDWFRGVRAVKKPTDGAALDGLRAHQFHLIRSETERKLPPAVRVRRNELEAELETLRASKGQVTEEKYYEQLEALLIELARLYESNAS
jgi:hypothetical protein